jgi:hypothetical protein
VAKAGGATVAFTGSTSFWPSCNVAGTPSGATDVVLDEHHLGALHDAAELARNPGLVPALRQLVIAYTAERDAGPAPQMCTVYKNLRDLARQTERLRRKLEFACWERRVMDELTEPPLPTYGHNLNLMLANTAQRALLAASRIDPGDGRPADRQPGSPRWRFAWCLAELWSSSGGYVGTGGESRFARFAQAVAAAADEALPERMLNELARQWQKQTAVLTAGTEKSLLLS